MRNFFFVLLFLPALSYSQTILKGKVVDEEGDPVIHATIQLIPLESEKPLFTRTDDNGGFQFPSLAHGSYQIKITYLGFLPYFDSVQVEKGKPLELTITMKENKLQETEVVVSATRTTRSIEDVPIRVEVIPAEDLDESITMGLGSARMVLGELPGIMSQTTSSGNGAATLRIRGLDGRYTQLLIDGIPAFGGLNMNFSILQLPPLNLRQLEIIKGSAAGLHGADAIGGIINFLTKVPDEKAPEATAVLNYSLLKGGDAAAYYSQKSGDLGFVLHTTFNKQVRRDIDGDGYVDVPAQERFFFNPKLIYSFSENTELTVAPSFTTEKRLGGLMSAPENYDHGSADVFSTALNTTRYDMLGTLSQKFDVHNSAVINAAFVRTQRTSYWQLTPFDGNENILYADGQWSLDLHPLQLLAGASYQSEQFSETSATDSLDRSFHFTNTSVFAQAEYVFSPMISALGSLRSDFHNVYGTAVLPRASLMLRPSEQLTVRLSAGSGWRAPSIFTENAEDKGFAGVPALHTTERERSESYTADAKYKFIAGEWVFSTDLNLFQTHIYDRTDLLSDSGGSAAWGHIGNLGSRGAELIALARYHTLDLFFGYTYADVVEGAQRKTFTPAHFINASVLWLLPGSIRLVSDLMYESPQSLPDNPYGKMSPAVMTIGASAEVWLSPSFSVFVNVENLFDDRQTKTMPTYLGTPGAKDFDSGFVWGPTEGRVINGGVKYKL